MKIIKVCDECRKGWYIEEFELNCPDCINKKWNNTLIDESKIIDDIMDEKGEINWTSER